MSPATAATLGDRRIALVNPLPSACTAKSKSLRITLTSSAIPHSKAAKLRFVSASPMSSALPPVCGSSANPPTATLCAGVR